MDNTSEQEGSLQLFSCLVSHRALRTRKVHVIFLSYTNPSNGQHKRTRRFIAIIFLFSIASRFKNEEGSCYLLVVPCANPSDRQHKRGRRFITMFLFSVASRFKNEEGSCYAFRVMSYCTARILEGLYDLTSVESNRLVGIRIDSIRVDSSDFFTSLRILVPRAAILLSSATDRGAFIRDLTSGKSTFAKRTSGESEVFDPRADSNRLCFKTIRLSLGVLDMSVG